MKKSILSLLASALAISGCVGMGVDKCNAIHARARVVGQQAEEALDRCLKRKTTSLECKKAMEIVDQYTDLSAKSAKCAKANGLDDNLLHSQLLLVSVTDKLEQLETRNRSEQRAIRR